MRWRKASESAPDALQRRVAALPTGDLYTWADQAIFSLGQALTQNQRHRLPGALQEAGVAVRALGALVEELERRQSS
jgi:hypothetical protein